MEGPPESIYSGGKFQLQIVSITIVATSRAPPAHSADIIFPSCSLANTLSNLRPSPSKPKSIIPTLPMMTVVLCVWACYAPTNGSLPTRSQMC